MSTIINEFRLRPVGFRGRLLVVANLSFVAVLLGAQIWRSGWCNDESAHIPAGLYHLETGRMDAYRVNPPLPRMLAAIPLLIDHPQMRWFSLPVRHARKEYAFAQDWIQGNLERIPGQLRLARSMILLYFLLGAWTVFAWTRELYGRNAGFLALTLWSLSPDVITYSATVAPDLPAAATGLFACYLYWKWLYADKGDIPWGVCISLALAILSKFSWLFLFALFPLLTVLHDSLFRARVTTQDWKFGSRRFSKLAIALLGTLLIINVVYGFEGTGRRLGDFEFLSKALGGEHEQRAETGNRYRGKLLGALPVPIPSEMLQGIDYVKWEFESGMPCYLLGEWKFRGWWYFYLVAMAVKIPIGYFVLLIIGLSSLLVAAGRKRSVPGEWLVLLVAVLFIAQVSTQTGFTRHMRYVLPAFGFLYIIAARSVLSLPQRASYFLIPLCLAGTVTYHVVYPGQAHAFFNTLAGGPQNGWRYLGLSNLDWGQSTFRMAEWARKHPDKRPLTLLFVSNLGDPSALVKDLQVATTVNWASMDEAGFGATPEPGWYLLSSKQLAEERNLYFRNKRPESWPYADVALYYVPDR